MEKIKTIIIAFAIPVILVGCTVEGALFFDDDSFVVIEFVSVDSEDGFIDANSVILDSGILVEGDFSSGFFTFHLFSIPRHAIISRAYLFIGVHTVFSSERPVTIDLFVDKGGFAGSFEIFTSDENNYILVDVTDILDEAHRSGLDIFQISLQARDGGVFLEDGGDNLETGLIPFIEVTYS